MGSFEAVKAEWSNIVELHNNLRQSDIDELWAASNLTPRIGLDLSYIMSVRSWAAVHDGKTIMVCGVAPEGESDIIGVPWMLGSNGILDAASHLARRSRWCVGEMLKRFRYLHNYVDARNAVSIRWLRWCGFTIDDPAPHGCEGLMFHHFWMEGPPCVART